MSTDQGDKKKTPDVPLLNAVDEPLTACEYVLIILSYLFFIITFPVTIFYSFKVVRTYERAVILHLGKPKRERGNPIVGAGAKFLLPFVDKLVRVDLRTRTVNIPHQDVLTRDAVTVNVDAVIYMRVVDPEAAMLKVEDAYRSAELLAISVLRTVLGSYDMAALLESREQIKAKLQTLLDTATDSWGIRVEHVEIKDVSLPHDMKHAMVAEAQAKQTAKAKIVMAQGELDASEALKQAAMQMASCPAALQLRYLQTLATIAAEQNSTIIFPLPIELLAAFSLKKNT